MEIPVLLTCVYLREKAQRTGWLGSHELSTWCVSFKYIYMWHIDARLCGRWISLVCWLLLLCLQQDGAYLLSVNNEGEFEFISQWLTRSELDRWGQVFLNQGERLSKRPSWELDKTPEKPMYTEAGDDVHVRNDPIARLVTWLVWATHRQGLQLCDP